MRSIRGVLLDVDGTLVDSNDAHARAWARALAEDRVDVPLEAIRRRIGMGSDKLLPAISGIDADSARGKKLSRRREEIFQEEEMPVLRAFPGVRELLIRMRSDGLRLAVASSAKENELNELLRRCGADDLIEARTSSDDVETSKPAPDILHAALERLGLQADEVLLLGDTPYDVEAARRAGLGVVAVRCGGWGDEDLSGAEAVYDGPRDLLIRYDASPFARG